MSDLEQIHREEKWNGCQDWGIGELVCNQDRVSDAWKVLEKDGMMVA